MEHRVERPAASLAEVGEDELVRRLVHDLPQGSEVVTGPGDDCALVKPLKSGWLQLLKTDCVVEGVHFLREMEARRVGWKAMARVVSDIGAMGGEPQHALVTLIAPPELPVTWVEELYAGLRSCGERHGVSIVGGETARGPVVVVSVSMSGRVQAQKARKRSDGRAGDVIAVTGRLGGSIAGHHLDFCPRLAEGRWLASRQGVHAMMDLSDGLMKDLPRLATASRLNFVVDVAALPLRDGCSPVQGWGDGEDYELLLTVAPEAWAGLRRAWRRAFPELELTRIGHLVPAGAGGMPEIDGGGWEHFS